MGRRTKAQLRGALGKPMDAAQRAALEAIVAGKSANGSATAAGVSRSTVYRWLRDDPEFRAQYNGWLRERQESAFARMMVLTDKAVDAIEAGLEKNDAKLALQVLKGLGVLGPGRREIGASDVEEVRRRMDLDRRKRNLELGEEEDRVRMHEAVTRLGQ